MSMSRGILLFLFTLATVALIVPRRVPAPKSASVLHRKNEEGARQ